MWTGSRGNVHERLNYMLAGRIHIQILSLATREVNSETARHGEAGPNYIA